MNFDPNCMFLVGQRCTGYRPILDGFQTFSCQGKSNVGGCHGGQKSCSEVTCGDIEESNIRSKLCSGQSTKRLSSKDGKTFMTVGSLTQLYSELRKGKSNGGVRMLRGNTGTGIYAPPQAKMLLDISRIPELSRIAVKNGGITIGGAVTLTDFMLVLEKNVDNSPTYAPLLKHFQRVSRTYHSRD